MNIGPHPPSERRIIMADNNNGFIDLDPKILDAISGGVMTQDEENTLLDNLIAIKSMGISLDTIWQQLPAFYDIYKSSYPNITYEDVEGFIKKNWDSL